MTRSRPRRVLYALVTAATALGTTVAVAGTSSAATSASAPKLVTNPASLVNPFIGTSGAVDTFPGPDMPFGMIQWSPDTSPDRPEGGGYEYNDSQLMGYSLAHVSGPGCSAGGDLPILPTVGAIGSSPSSTTDSFTHASETAQTGLYSDTLGNGVTVKLTDTTRAGIGTFNFPASSQANLLLKLSGSADQVDGTSAQIVGDNQVTGTVQAGHFCGQSAPPENDYTLHFDIVFNHAFTSSGTWGGSGSSSSATNGSKKVAQNNVTHKNAATPKATAPSTKVFAGAKPDLKPRTQPQPTVHGAKTASPQTTVTNPDGVYLTFDTTKNQTVTAKVGISYTSDANAATNLSSEIPAWNFSAAQKANVAAWNALLGKIQIGGGDAAQQTQFYTAMYHALLHPNVFSDDNGQYMGFDGQVHTVAKGHQAYANWSGWDIYRDQVQLAAMVAPQQTSDAITSMLADYSQTGMLPKWNLDGGESYVMVGDPADEIIADAYSFGAQDFDVSTALKDMEAEATSTNNIRPGNATLQSKGYLPYDGTYGCCNFYGPVSTQLEYDSADYAIASLAKATGDTANYTKFATLAQSWQNTFNAGSGYMQAKLSNGQWLPGFTPGTSAGFVEGTSAQYTPMVPFNLQALINARGGNAAWVSYLNSLTSNLTSPSGTNADLSNEPSLEIPYEYDYAGAPYLTQQTVRNVEDELYFDAPVGSFGNDDLGAMSSAYVWDELGFYPETPGTPTLALGSPVFAKAVVHEGSGNTLTINASGAQDSAPYIQSMKVNGQAWNKAYLDYGTLSAGGTLNYTLSSTPNKSWATSASAAPPSDSTGEQTALDSAGPASGLVVAPGSTGTATLTVDNLTNQAITANWTATPSSSNLTVTPTSGTLTVPAGSSATAQVTVTAGATEGAYSVSFTAKLSDGTALPDTAVGVDVAKPGELWPYYTSIGMSNDGQVTSSGYNGDSWLYSATALAATGVTPGSTVNADGIAYTWPNEPAGSNDAIEASGQTIPVVLPSGATKIGLLGSATDADASGASGTLTVTYTDGSTQQIPVAFSDWTLGAGAYQPLSGDTVAATTPYRNIDDGTSDGVKTYVYSVSAALQSGKTVASVTLPNPSNGFIGVFDIGGA
ncbi:MAG TPA: lectin [Streptosporangiaceae bacterium]